MTIEKHEQFTPKDVNPSSLVLIVEVLAVSKCENKDLKSKLYQKSLSESRNVGLNLIVCCFLVPVMSYDNQGAGRTG